MGVEDWETVNLEEFLSSTGDVILSYGGIDFPAKYLKGSTNTIVFLFHGATDQSKRPYPLTTGFFPTIPGLHQVSISDAAMAASINLASTWYIGAENIDTQDILHHLMMDISRRVGATRRIYLGGSAGGFAALYYSWRDKGSLAIVGNPQTNLNSYALGANGKPNRFIRYVNNAWPNLSSYEDLENTHTVDVASLYRRKFENSVIYLQSSGDREHISSQLFDLLAATKGKLENFVLNMNFYGILGHSGSVPVAAFRPWLLAALAAPGWSADEILVEWHAQNTLSAGKAKPLAAKKAEPTPQHDPADIRIATVLRNLALARAGEVAGG